MKQLFGTDGIRGVANEYPMTAEMALRVGRVVATYFAEAASDSKIVIGKDTRLSGDMLESGIVAGICAAGANAYLTDVLPTPGVAFVTSALKAMAGIVVSASHNPYYDNGIKIFKGDGYKLSDETEIEIEKMILDETLPARKLDSRKIGTAHPYHPANSNYIAFLKNTLAADKPFQDLKIVLDCSNGATYQIAPKLFAELGAQVVSFAVQPDGININDDCGSEHPEALIQTVLRSRANIGLAFDGDGDRLIAVDESGRVLSGDHILAICARDMKQKGTLKNNLVVSTVMSNMGFGVALKQLQINHEVVQVGDRYVMQKMKAAGAVLGGEDSGHMIFADYHTTGDGMLTALKLIEAMQTEKKPLSELSAIMMVYPQVMINVAVNSKPAIESIPQIIEAIRSAEADLAQTGRVLVRYSGTQPLCRVMVEGPDEAKTQRICKQLSVIIKKSIGTG
ncbi:Phosphoglucosamine mutase (EC [Olavius sp. associated proteobacterium Delta 1]|nr:Phosphoglucosamine mutase (EC [Olavius sp. associated proteobacterium Delta 1]